MKEMGYEEFTNKHNDTVLIQLSEDSFGGFHLIVKCKSTRRKEEHRVVNGTNLIKVPTSTFADETSHTQLPDARTAMVEFKLACMMHNMPGFGGTEFQEWLRTSAEEASNGD